MATPGRMHLLDLPTELIIRILSYLPIPALRACKHTGPTLCHLIRTSILLQYHTATLLAGVVDNPTSHLSMQERLHVLQGLEDTWARLDFDFERTVHVAHDPSRICGLTGGVYLLGDSSREAFYHCTLPSRPSDETSWRKVEVGKSIIDVGVNVYEYDLAAVVTTTPRGVAGSTYAIEIVLLQLSTGKQHPHACAPHIYVSASPWPRPAIGIEIVGDTLALVTTHHQNLDRPDDNFYVFDWKSGILRMHATAPHGSYSQLLFLTPTLLLLPNGNAGTLEYWDAHPGPGPPRPLAALALPALRPGHTISKISCRCEPNPHTAGTPHAPPGLGFFARAEEAVAIFHLRVHGLEVGIEYGVGVTFTMFARRGALAGLCRWARQGGGGEEVARDGQAGGAEPPFEVIPWDEWGPDATRWLNAGGGAAQWIMTTAGARAVVMVESVGAVVIMDFHPARLPVTTSSLAHIQHPSRGPGPPQTQDLPRRRRACTPKSDLRVWVEHGEVELEQYAFMGRVVSRLPYAGRSLARLDVYGGVLMDEERLIGLVTDESGLRVKEIVLHHLGSVGVDDGSQEDGPQAGAGTVEDAEKDMDVEETDTDEGGEWATGENLIDLDGY